MVGGELYVERRDDGGMARMGLVIGLGVAAGCIDGFPGLGIGLPDGLSRRGGSLDGSACINHV